MLKMQFMNRQAAGKALADALHAYTDSNAVVATVPKGGVVLGFEVAKSLHVPLGLILARKIGHPAFKAYEIAAVAEGEEPVYTETELMPVDDLWLTHAEARTRHLIKHQRELYFTKDYHQPDMSNHTVIIVNDGMINGLTELATIRAVKRFKPARIVLAVPVASRDSIELLEPVVDELVILDTPRDFQGLISDHYQSFPRINDLTVRQLLERSTTYGLQHPTTI
jgi:putative phosphoribosyl transferase